MDALAEFRNHPEFKNGGEDFLMSRGLLSVPVDAPVLTPAAPVLAPTEAKASPAVLPLAQSAESRALALGFI